MLPQQRTPALDPTHRDRKSPKRIHNPVFGSKKHLINEWAISAFGPPSPSEAQSMVDRKGIRKHSYRSNKVFKATWSGFGLSQKCSPFFTLGQPAYQTRPIAAAPMSLT